MSAARADRAASDVPRSTAVVSRTALDERADRTSPEALQDRSGGWVQKTNHGGGSPFLRGLVGNQVLVLIDGVRLNNATFRLGPNQYMNTIDAFSLERIEIVRGSGSVQYGSDALGGVVNLVSPLPVLSPGGVRAGGSVATRLVSAGMEQTARVEGRVAGSRAGVRGGVTLRNFGDLVAGGSLGTEAPSAYRESDADVSAIWAPSPRTTFTGVFQSVYQEEVPRFDQVAQRGYDVYEFDPQSRRLGYLQWQQLVSSRWLDLSRVTLSWQRSDEGRRRRRTGSDLETTESDTVATVGFSADLYGRLASRAGWSAGVEVYHDTVRSWRLDTNLATGASKPMRGLYPDGATRLSVSAFALANLTLGRAGIDVGARYTRDDVEADDPVFGPLRITPDAVVGSVSVLVPLGGGVNAFGSVAQAFRAPNIDDLSTLGAFDFGVEVPSEGLDPERSVSVEGGIKANTSRVAATFAVVPAGAARPDRPSSRDVRRLPDLGRSGCVPARQRRRSLRAGHRGGRRVARHTRADAARIRGEHLRPANHRRRAHAADSACQRPRGCALPLASGASGSKAPSVPRVRRRAWRLATSPTTASRRAGPRGGRSPTSRPAPASGRVCS